MNKMDEQKANDEAIDDEDKRQSYDDETEWWILASST
jgi:hypothetical protein